MRFITGGVGFFDSGIGGLTVLHACRKRLPNTVFYYLGDNARAPYGNLPTSTIRQYTYEAFSLFQTLGVQAVVVACNTVTAVCIEEMRGLFSFPIIGTEPAVFPAMQTGGRIGVLTTRATGGSARFLRLIETSKRKSGNPKCIPLICSELAKAVEIHLKDSQFDYAPYLPKANVDGIVLGCTHYVFIKKQIERHYGCPAWDGNDGIARRLKNVIKEQEDKGVNDYDLPPVLRLRLPFCALTDREENSPIFFFGGQKEHNKRIYEQMFV